MNFHMGERVRSKAGGPEMVVMGVANRASVRAGVTCEWFDDGFHREGSFAQGELERAARAMRSSGIFSAIRR
jgi:uncharacterized protein YodC (DUF2158 family)